MQCTYLIHARYRSDNLHSIARTDNRYSSVPELYRHDAMRGRMSMGKVHVEAAKVLTPFITGCSSDGSGQNSAQQQSYSENSQLHLDQEQLRESLKKITFSLT